MYILYFTSVVTGIIFGIGAVGLGIIYRYLKFPDFTTIVSLSIGSAVMAVVSVSPTSILLAILLSILAGGFLEVNEILAGIITSVGALSIIYLITNNQAIVPSSDTVKIIFNKLLSSKFSYWNIVIIGFIGLLISFLVSRIFNTKYGLYILGMLGTRNYLNHRHRNKEKATLIILLMGNSIIGFAGSILTIQNGNFNISGTPDFFSNSIKRLCFSVILDKHIIRREKLSPFSKGK